MSTACASWPSSLVRFDSQPSPAPTSTTVSDRRRWPSGRAPRLRTVAHVQRRMLPLPLDGPAGRRLGQATEVLGVVAGPALGHADGGVVLQELRVVLGSVGRQAASGCRRPRDTVSGASFIGRTQLDHVVVGGADDRPPVSVRRSDAIEPLDAGRGCCAANGSAYDGGTNTPSAHERRTSNHGANVPAQPSRTDG